MTQTFLKIFGSLAISMALANNASIFLFGLETKAWYSLIALFFGSTLLDFVELNRNERIAKAALVTAAFVSSSVLIFSI